MGQRGAAQAGRIALQRGREAGEDAFYAGGGGGGGAWWGGGCCWVWGFGGGVGSSWWWFLEGRAAWPEEAREGLLERTHGLGAVLVLLERQKGGSRAEGSLGCFGLPKEMRDGVESEVLSDVSASSKAGGVGFGD